MQIFSLLSTMADVMVLPEGYRIGLNWLGHFARIIIEGVGIIGLGIILFNLVLKAITLPFEIYQRVMTRKQNLVMQKMQPELEKLQKQYANDKQMYSQKMLELQKKSGYSMLGACLPMIVSFVILIIAWQGFRAYSQYANLNLFVKMSESYNAAVLEKSVDIGTVDFHMEEREDGKYDFYRVVDGEEERFTVEWQNDIPLPAAGDVSFTMTEITKSVEEGEETQEIKDKVLTVTSNDAAEYIFYQYDPTMSVIERNYKLDRVKFAQEIVKVTAEEGDTVTQGAIDAANAYLSDANAANETALDNAGTEYLKKIGSEAAANRFRGDSPRFLWIKNVWYPDVSYDHPIPNYGDFTSLFSRDKVTTADGRTLKPADLITEPRYEALTAALGHEKSTPNGYFILIVLSIGFMLLSQIIAMKSNKTANKYQTVDGQGAMTQKVMLVVMPLIYAFFAFSYSAAFSIYMTMSSIVGIIVTLLTNFILGKVFKRKEEKASVEEHTRKLPWMK